MEISLLPAIISKSRKKQPLAEKVKEEKNNRWRFRTFAPSYIKTNGKEETKEAAGSAVPLARAVYQTEGTELGDRSVLCE
jgi:hypothetical protein